MHPDGSDRDTRLAELGARLIEVERRLTLLERRSGATEERAADTAEVSLGGRPSSAETVALVGRTMLALAGAFLLRAITSRPGETSVGPLPLGLGTTLGIVYALTWIVLADRAARAGRQYSAAFHGFAGGVVAFPLVWEATVPFDLLPPWAGAGVLLVVAAVGFGIAYARNLMSLAWICGLGAASTAVAIAVPTKTLVLNASLLLLLGLAALWLGYLRQWFGLAWTLAALADLTVLLMTSVALLGQDPERVAALFSTGALVAVQLALPLAYCLNLGIHTLWRNEHVRVGEIVQAAAALTIGLGGAVAIGHTFGTRETAIGVVALLLAAGAYGVSFTFLDRHAGIRRNFIFYSTLALCLTLLGLAASIRGVWLAPALAAIALAAAWIGAVRERATLSGHGALYAAAAIMVSGSPALAIQAFVGPEPPPLSAITPALLVALCVAAACAVLPVAAHGRTWRRLLPLPKLVLIALFAVGAGGTIVVLAAPLVGADGVDTARLAVLRTAVLAVSALLLARIGRISRLAPAGWLVYPILVVTAIKLVAEDLLAGRPATLVASFALFGTALILAPRWVRRTAEARPT